MTPLTTTLLVDGKPELASLAINRRAFELAKAHAQKWHMPPLRPLPKTGWRGKLEHWLGQRRPVYLLIYKIDEDRIYDLGVYCSVCLRAAAERLIASEATRRESGTPG